MQPANLKITLPEGFSFEMIYVEGGEFDMGSNHYDIEKPIHRVKVSSLYLGKYPVTQQLWQAVMGGNPSYFKGDLRPVERVSWDMAKDFCSKLTDDKQVKDFFKKIALPVDKFRLPTEAEWEYAARGGRLSSGTTKYAGSDHLDEVGWYVENSYDETKAVGLKLPNELGLFDMSGNVWEWCEDLFDSDYYKECAAKGLSINPPGPEKGYDRVQRGGSCFSDPGLCRAAYRYFWPPGYRGNLIGFRLALSPQFSP